MANNIRKTLAAASIAFLSACTSVGNVANDHTTNDDEGIFGKTNPKTGCLEIKAHKSNDLEIEAQIICPTIIKNIEP